MITMDTCHAVHPVYGTLECPAERGQPQFLKRFPRRNAPPTSYDGAFRPTSWQALLCDGSPLSRDKCVQIKLTN